MIWWCPGGSPLRTGLNLSRDAELVLYFSSRRFWCRCYHRLNGPQWIWWEWCWATRWIPAPWNEPGLVPEIRNGPALYSAPWGRGRWDATSVFFRHHWMGFVVDAGLLVSLVALGVGAWIVSR